MARTVIFSTSCGVAAQRLGGYEKIDVTLEAAYQALMVNPYGFPKIESDLYRARYVITIEVGDIPSLVWLFTINDQNDVVMNHVERLDPY